MRPIWISFWGRFDLGPIWLRTIWPGGRFDWKSFGLSDLRTIGLYCHGTVDIETILNTNQKSGVCTTILFFGVPNDWIQWIARACIYLVRDYSNFIKAVKRQRNLGLVYTSHTHSTGACYDFFLFFFTLNLIS